MTNYVNGVINTVGVAYTDGSLNYVNVDTVVSGSSQIVSTNTIAVLIGGYQEFVAPVSFLNFGFIYGAQIGLKFHDYFGEYASWTARIVNGTSGVITGATGVFLEGRVALNNLGEISGRDYGITLVSQDLSVITNSGVINASGWAIFADGNTSTYAM